LPHRLRKVRKLRGSRTHGWGQVGQHRGIGMRGGHGKAGRKKHKWTYVVKHDPNYFGKHGFQRSWVNRPTTMNVGELDTQIEELVAREEIRKEDAVYHINLEDLGIAKLLDIRAIEGEQIVIQDKHRNVFIVILQVLNFHRHEFVNRVRFLSVHEHLQAFGEKRVVSILNLLLKSQGAVPPADGCVIHHPLDKLRLGGDLGNNRFFDYREYS